MSVFLSLGLRKCLVMASAVESVLFDRPSAAGTDSKVSTTKVGT